MRQRTVARGIALPHLEEPLDPTKRYRTVRAASEALTAPLSAEDCSIQSMEDASPAKWHLAHTTWFFETLVLETAEPHTSAFEHSFRFLFNSYYDSVGEQYPRPHRGLLSRPSLDEVLDYRRHVDERVLALLAEGLAPEQHAVIELGLHHEQQHQELLLTDVKHALSFNPWRPAYRAAPPAEAARAPTLRWFDFEAGLREIGHAGDDFAFDNECPRHRVFVEAFQLASRPVTNGEYLEFMKDGGYERPDPWLAEGWHRVQREAWKAPLYWEHGDAGWTSLTLSGRHPVDLDAPVCHVSGYEANAFARWAGGRLPTEAEWETAAEDPIDGNFVESGEFQPRPSPDVADRPAALFGDVWEWTASAYTPYPGFRPPTGALGEYNGKFMSSQLVLRGGSCASPASHLRASYRNFFHPHQRWQFSGIRLARDTR